MVEPRVGPFSPDARAAFRTLDQTMLGRLRASQGSGYSSILAHIEENASKLALIRAVSRDPVDPVIEGHDAEWGIMLSRHCAELTIREVPAGVPASGSGYPRRGCPMPERVISPFAILQGGCLYMGRP